MTNSELILDASKNYAKAQDLALLIRYREIYLSISEKEASRNVFRKWIIHFANLAKNTQDLRHKHNYSYLKNQFCNYYRTLS